MNVKTWLRRFGIALLSLLLAAGTAQAAESGTVRVLLSRLNAQTSMNFRTNCRYSIDGAEIPADTDVAVELTDGRLRVSFGGNDALDCGTEAKLLRGAAETGGIRFEMPKTSNLYCGDLCLTAQKGAIVPVLSMNIEDYVRGVLGDANTNPMEAIKAEAVAARSYAMRREETEEAQMYDLADDADGYVFEGDSAAWTRTRQAVDETRGMVLYADDAPALCRSTDSNGGQTESAENAWGLEGGVVKDDPYDLESRMSPVRTAQISRKGAELDAQLQEYLIDGMAQQLIEWGMSPKESDISIQNVTSVEPVDPAYPEPSRVYRALLLTMKVRSANPSTGKPVDCSVSLEVPTFGGIEDWYDLSINPEENETVTVTETEDMFEIALRRSGSGVGLSRCGATAMAARYDMDCAAILDFYFPGTEMRTVEMTVSDPAQGDGAEMSSLYVLPTIAPVEAEIAATTVPAPTATPAPVETPESVETVSAAPTYPAEALLPLLTPEADTDAVPVEEEAPVEMPAPDDGFEIAQDEMLADADGIPSDELPEDPAEILPDDFDEDLSLDDFSDDIMLDDFDDLSLDDFDDMVSLDELDDEIPLDEEDGFEEDVPETLPEMTVPAQETRWFVNVKASGSLTLRSQPSERGEKLGRLRRGESVQMIGLGGGWAQVVTEAGQQGYVSTAYLTDTKPKDEPAMSAWERFCTEHADAKKCDKTAKARVNVWMRAAASTEAEKLCKVAGGKQVRVLGYDSKWAYVSYREKTGFIMKKYLKFGA